MPEIPDDHRVLVLCGDVPLVRLGTLRALEEAAGDDVGLLTVILDDPTGYGRVVRGADGTVHRIVEEKDADEAEKQLVEVNSGVMCLPAGPLRRWLHGVSSDNAQGEYYLPDVISAANADGVAVHALAIRDAVQVQGVNNRAQLAVVERAFQWRQADALMREQGLTLIDPARFDLRGRLTVGTDCVVDVNAVIEGEVEFGNGVHIGPNVYLRDCRIGDGAEILPNTVIEESEIGEDSIVGPFARMRPGTRLAEGAKVGNFVETKNSLVGPGSKVNHLSYVGDTEIGRHVNIGAGTITCNYDGANKHRTVIDDDAFIGSGTQLVAPVRVGRGATIGAGATLRRDAPDDGLTLCPSRQKTIAGWQRPRKKKPGDG
jgi:bifunctional UDP-N-acetylglucosamine pyrophosphorylase/glucosamine-1-phosphate N-acetyltransferase